ncbi:hypothetical protein J6590_016131 [Homalodisca vitripennis]|nr:hypothetical protein J6590_016131 [Homalodisca vitripennis]
MDGITELVTKQQSVWCWPPTLPGDHRFGKERSRAGAGLKDRAHGPIMKPNVAVNHKTETQHLSNNHLHPNIEHHKEVMQHMQQSLHPDTPNHQVLHNLQPPLHLNTANLRSPQTSQSLQAHIAAQEHEHLQESLHGLHMNHPAHDGKDHLHDPIHLADHHEPDNHHGVPLVLPAQHQGIAIKDGIANHKIQKRKADSTSAELKEDSSGVMSTKELTAAAEEYKKQVASKEFGVYSTYPDSEEYVKLADEDPIAAYEKEKKLRTMNPFTGSPRTTRHYFQKTSKPLLRRRKVETSNLIFPPPPNFCLKRLTDQEKKNKEADAPMEALNPALYMHRNMVQVKKKPQSGDNPLEGIPDGAELIAVIVSPQEAAAGLPAAVRELDLHKMKKKQRRKLKKPIVYNKNNEALNPLLYKHRNIKRIYVFDSEQIQLLGEFHESLARKMKLVCNLFLCLCAVSVHGFSMSMRDVGITRDIHSVASSLNDIFKESFELMIGSLGKHGVYYLSEFRQVFNCGKTGEEMKQFDFHASNGWLKNPTIKAADGMDAGALRKYKVPLAPNMREILLVCVECLEVSAESVNFCYEATFDGRNVSGTITSGPVLYKLSLQMRITQTLNGGENDDVPPCKVTLGERSFELSEHSNLEAEVRGLRSFNFATNLIDTWLREHLNTTIRANLEKRLLTSLDKVMARHEVCEEFVTETVERLKVIHST